MTIFEIISKYKGKLDYLDIEIIIANSLAKTREFVLTYPEFKISKTKLERIEINIKRRLKGEPIAYIIGRKEFYGLNFIVNKSTLIPRPETEMIVELVKNEINKTESAADIIDIGTGSGCIIISVASTTNSKSKLSFYGSDISKEALLVAKKNAKANGANKKIKFLHGNLLQPFLNNKKLISKKIIITANLPYLSRNIYQSAPIDVKKFEPKSALYSSENGLQHYRKLLQQTISLKNKENEIIILLEISPEQKTLLTKIIKSITPLAEIEFKKDLAKKWRLCKIEIQTN